MFLKDTDGDDKADVREVLFGTWSQRDTHGGPSNMQYGLDNWVWAMQGYNQSRLRVGGETHEFRQGFCFKPDGSKLEFVRSTNNNTWGLGISEEGIVFGSTANRNPSVYMPIPNRYYESAAAGPPRWCWVPSPTRTCSARQRQGPPGRSPRRLHGRRRPRAVHGPRLPEGVLEPRRLRRRADRPPHRRLRARRRQRLQVEQPVQPARQRRRVDRPDHGGGRPDGNVWVIDWYNYIVQHNPTPQGFRTAGPPRTRRTCATRSTAASTASSTATRSRRRNPEGRDVFRRDAEGRQPVLAAARASCSSSAARRTWCPWLLELARDRSTDEIGLNVGVIHALWTLHGLGAIDKAGDELRAALNHLSAGVRRNAVQVMPATEAAVAAILDAGLTRDADAQVRLMGAGPGGPAGNGEGRRGGTGCSTTRSTRTTAGR